MFWMFRVLVILLSSGAVGLSLLSHLKMCKSSYSVLLAMHTVKYTGFQLQRFLLERAPRYNEQISLCQKPLTTIIPMLKSLITCYGHSLTTRNFLPRTCIFLLVLSFTQCTCGTKYGLKHPVFKAHESDHLKSETCQCPHFMVACWSPKVTVAVGTSLFKF